MCTCVAARVWCNLSRFKNVTVSPFQASNKKLPHPNGELSATISSAAIREANREVVAVEVTERGKKPYKKISHPLRAKIAHYALQNGNDTKVF